MTKQHYTPTPAEQLAAECRTLAAIAGVTPEQVRRYVDGYAKELDTTPRAAVDNLNVCLAFSVQVDWGRYDSKQEAK